MKETTGPQQDRDIRIIILWGYSHQLGKDVLSVLCF
jgi:hypothetical protein